MNQNEGERLEEEYHKELMSIKVSHRRWNDYVTEIEQIAKRYQSPLTCLFTSYLLDHSKLMAKTAM